MCAVGGQSGKIGNVDSVTNMGWMLGLLGQAGKFIKGVGWRSRGCSDATGSVGIGNADEIGKVGRIGSRC